LVEQLKQRRRIMKIKASVKAGGIMLAD